MSSQGLQWELDRNPKLQEIFKLAAENYFNLRVSMRLPIKYILKVMFEKKKCKPGTWRWLSCKANDTVFITYGRSLVILLTKRKVLFTFYNKERHNHSYEKTKAHLRVSTACVRRRGDRLRGTDPAPGLQQKR